MHRAPRGSSLSVRALAVAAAWAGGVGLIAGTVLFAARPRPAHAAPTDYVGAPACGGCHPRELAIWQASAHARAGAAASLGKRQRDPACLGCHGTGEGADARALRPGVECEACHGGGAEYALADVMKNPALARALGLKDLAAAPLALCATCHLAGRGPADAAGTRAAPFDAARAWKKIAH